MQEAQRTRKADILEGWRRLRKLMRSFALTPGPWTMALGGDPGPNPSVALGGGEGALLARRHHPQMFWKLSHATRFLGMRMLM